MMRGPGDAMPMRRTRRFQLSHARRGWLAVEYLIIAVMMLLIVMAVAAMVGPKAQQVMTTAINAIP